MTLNTGSRESKLYSKLNDRAKFKLPSLACIHRGGKRRKTTKVYPNEKNFGPFNVVFCLVYVCVVCILLEYLHAGLI